MSTLPLFTFTFSHISGMLILGGEAPVVWEGREVEHFGEGGKLPLPLPLLR